MILVLDGHTSAEFFRKVYPLDHAPFRFAELPAEMECAYSQEDVWSLAPSFMTTQFLRPTGGRLCALAFEHGQRRSSASHAVRTWSGPIPPGSFNDYGGGVLLSSPAFTFLQMASQLSFSHLVAYGDELCGTYSLDESAERGFRTRQVPLVSVSALEEYLRCARGCRGYRFAKRALRHIVDGSASPMETRDEMQLCLPICLGGYGIAQPSMNQAIELSPSAARLARKSVCYADLMWSESNLIVEHQGEHDHMGSARFNDDRARVNALKLMDYTVFELTRAQALDLSAFEQVALEVARRLGRRVRSESRGPTPQRRELHAALSAWGRSYGRTCDHVRKGTSA